MQLTTAEKKQLLKIKKDEPLRVRQLNKSISSLLERCLVSTKSGFEGGWAGPKYIEVTLTSLGIDVMQNVLIERLVKSGQRLYDMLCEEAGIPDTYQQTDSRMRAWREIKEIAKG